MSGAFRIPSAGRLKQAKTARFSFDGQSYAGIEGDTLASALLANGVHLVGRWFKYHRPRGILSAGAEEPNALVEVKRDAANVGERLQLVAPFVTMGQKLCDQPAGARVGHGEL